MRSFIAALRRLVVPWGATTGPRVVIATDDPIMESLSQDAAIMWYWNDTHAFMASVEQSGSPDFGQFHLFATTAGFALAQFIDCDYDIAGPTSRISIGQNADQSDIAANNEIDISAPVITIDTDSLELQGFGPAEGSSDVTLYGISIGRGLRGIDSNIASSGAIGAEAIVLTLTNQDFFEGRAYEILLGGRLAGSVANNGLFQIRLTNLAGAIVGIFGQYPVPAAGVNVALSGRLVFARAAGAGDLTQTLVLTLTASAGTCTHVGAATAPRSIEVRDIGAEGDYPDSILL